MLGGPTGATCQHDRCAGSEGDDLPREGQDAAPFSVPSSRHVDVSLLVTRPVARGRGVGRHRPAGDDVRGPGGCDGWSVRCDEERSRHHRAPSTGVPDFRDGGQGRSDTSTIGAYGRHPTPSQLILPQGAGRLVFADLREVSAPRPVRNGVRTAGCSVRSIFLRASGAIFSALSIVANGQVTARNDVRAKTSICCQCIEREVRMLGLPVLRRWAVLASVLVLLFAYLVFLGATGSGATSVSANTSLLRRQRGIVSGPRNASVSLV